MRSANLKENHNLAAGPLSKGVKSVRKLLGSTQGIGSQ